MTRRRQFNIVYDDTAVRLLRADSDALEWEIRWQEIIEIAAWKRDLVAVDLICLGFRWAGSEVYKEVDEETEGWDALIKQIRHRYGADDREWWREVAFPAFATNLTTIWGEPLPPDQVVDGE